MKNEGGDGVRRQWESAVHYVKNGEHIAAEPSRSYTTDDIEPGPRAGDVEVVERVENPNYDPDDFATPRMA